MAGTTERSRVVGALSYQLPLHQIPDHLPQTLLLSLRDPKEGQPECLAAHLLPAQVSMAVIRAAKHAQLPGVSLHTLRHTFISRLVQAGRPLPEVAALAGHRDIKMTPRYLHLAPSHLRAGIHA